MHFKELKLHRANRQGVRTAYTEEGIKRLANK